MPDTVQERTGRNEQEIYSLKWRVSKLEEWPPAVAQAQREIDALNATLIHVQRSQQETRDIVDASFRDMGLKIDHGFKEVREAVAVDKGRRVGASAALQMVVLASSAVGVVTAAVVWVLGG